MSPKTRPQLPKVKAPPELEGDLRASLEEAEDPAKLRELAPEQLEHVARTGEWPDSSD